MYSLEKRLTRRLLISMLVVMLALLIVSYFSVRQILQDYIVTRLQHDGDSLISALETNQQGDWYIENDRMSSVYNRVRSGHYYQVGAGEQILGSRSLFDSVFPEVRVQSSKSSVYTIKGLGDELWLVWYQRFNKRGAEIDIWIAEDILPVQLRLLEYTAYASMLILLVTTLLTLTQRQILRRSFRVFDHLKENLASIRHGADDSHATDIPREVVPLVNEIRHLVEQLRKRIERTRNAIGNLAHELKRPVQILSISRDEGAEYLQEPLEEIERIIDRELKKAKISGARDVGGTFDPVEELPAIIEVMRKIYPEVRVVLQELRVAEPIDIDRDDALELIGNLLENACKFAERLVRVDCMQEANKLVLRFEDDGPGLEDELLNDVLNRGVRLDETIPGSGLGLSICIDILDMYQGDMSFAGSKLGGLLVEVAIPVEFRANQSQ